MIQIINIFDLNEIKIGIFTLPRLYRYRGEDFSGTSFIKNLPGIWNSLFLYDGVDFNTIPGYYTMYVISIPFAILGIGMSIVKGIKVAKFKIWDCAVVFICFLLLQVILGCILNTDGPNTYRLNSVFIAMIYFIIVGIDSFREFLSKKSIVIGMVVTVLILLSYSVYFISFATYYFGDYKSDTYLIPLFQHKFDDALEYLNTEFDEEVAVRTTYIGDLNQTYIYYLGSTMISPFEYNKLNVEDSQHLWEWAARYRNYDFNLPETLDLNANYIVVDTNETYINMLSKAGFESVVKGHYYVFTNPWESFEDISTMKTEWDLGVSKENQIDLNTAISDVQGVPSVVLVGWTFQGNAGYLWDDVFIKIGENTYRPEMVERQDVVEKTKNNEILNCGMVYVIPADVLENAERIEMIALDTKKKVKETTVITIQK